MKSTLKVRNPRAFFMTCRYTCISEHLQVAAFYVINYLTIAITAMWDNYLCVVIVKPPPLL